MDVLFIELFTGETSQLEGKDPFHKSFEKLFLWLARMFLTSKLESFNAF